MSTTTLVAELGRILYQVQAGGVKRWHAEATTTQQTVAQHSFNVALILMRIVPAKELSQQLLVAALLHDMGEAATGDIPATTRWALGDEFQNALDGLELRARQRAGLVCPAITDRERQYLMAADHIEAYMFSLLQLASGNQLAWSWIQRCQSREYKHAGISTNVAGLYNALRAITNETTTGQAGVLRAIKAVGIG